MSACYLAVLDAGTTVLKLVLLSQESPTQQRLCASWVAPRLQFESTIDHLLSQARDWIHDHQAGNMEIGVIGLHTETPQLSDIKWRMSHEDALRSVTRRLSSTSTTVIVDIGSRRTFVALGKFGKVSIESFDHGVGVEAWNIVRQQLGLESVRAWLSLDIDDKTIENYLANKSLYAEIIPSSDEELMIEQAVARAILQGVTKELSFPWNEIDMLVVTGSVLTQTPVIAQTVGMVLDGLAPVGTLQLIADPSLLLMPCGGAFEMWSPKDYRVGRAILHQALNPLGTLVGLDTSADGHSRLAKVTLDTGLDQQQILDVRIGDLVQIPMPASDPGALKVVGAHSSVLRQAAELQAIGGEAGLVIDGRGRPLVLADNDNDRRIQLLQWDRQLNAHGQYGIIGVTSA